MVSDEKPIQRIENADHEVVIGLETRTSVAISKNGHNETD